MTSVGSLIKLGREKEAKKESLQHTLYSIHAMRHNKKYRYSYFFPHLRERLGLPTFFFFFYRFITFAFLNCSYYLSFWPISCSPESSRFNYPVQRVQLFFMKLSFAIAMPFMFEYSYALKSSS